MIVLFDLDGTVLTFADASPGPGRASMERAMFLLHGLAGASKGMRFAGGTDRGIARALLARTGMAAEAIDDAIDPFLATYAAELRTELKTRRYRPVGDVVETARVLREKGALVTVATGNTREGARLKLDSAGLTHCFDLSRGGFGCDAEERPDVLRAALKRSRASEGHENAPVVVVGDTEYDVSAARAIGAKCVGVALRDEVREELQRAGADLIVDDCGPAVIDAIASVSRELASR